MNNMKSIIEALKSEGIGFRQLDESSIKVGRTEFKFTQSLNGKYYIDIYESGQYESSILQSEEDETINDVFSYLGI